MNPHVSNIPKRILCVEDDYDTSTMLCSLLGLINCEVVTSYSMVEGLGRAREERFDLFLLDSWLPGGSGIELCRKIREFDRDSPIIFYSAAGHEDERESAIDAGAQAYLIKPSDINKLLETVRQHLQ